jgi:hypothetical protein
LRLRQSLQFTFGPAESEQLADAATGSAVSTAKQAIATSLPPFATEPMPFIVHPPARPAMPGLPVVTRHVV